MPAQKATLSPRDLAHAVGVSESSVKRWADDGRLQFVRTAGGHRRIRTAEAVRFIREAGLEVDRPDLLGLHGADPAGRGSEPDANSVGDVLRAGDGEGARRILVSTFLQGTSIAALCDGPIRGALSDLGHLWKDGPEGIALEHQAVDVCVQALMEIRAMIAIPRKAPLALGGAVERDPYVLPSMMAGLVLADAGFQTLNLGPNLPAKALRASIEANRPAVVWRSTSIDIDGATLRADVKALKPKSGKSADVVFGGRGLPRSSTQVGNALHVFESMTELAGFARALRHGRSRRR